MIDVQAVSYRIGGQTVLEDVSLSIGRGEVVALIGPNGAGKSTLLSLIARLLPLQAGIIDIDGLRIGHCADAELARTLAILPQDLSVNSRLSVRDLVGFGRYPHNKGRPGPADQAIISEAIELFDLSDLATRPLDSLSGGQRQRAFVAMAYAQDTTYLLLDEPLNNLDIAASRALMRLLRRMAKDMNRTVVIVVHDINYAAAYADRIIALKAGRIAADGAPADIITDAFLQRVFNTDAQVVRVGLAPLVRV